MDVMILVLYVVLGAIIVLLGFLFFLWLYILRDPAREVPQEECVVSTADGHVADVMTIDENSPGNGEDKERIKEFLRISKEVGKKVHVITIRQEVLDVHVQRTPIDGKVISVKHLDAKTENAAKRGALKNERIEVMIKDANMRVKVLIISGGWLAKTESFVKEEDVLFKGQRVGKALTKSESVLIIPQFFKLNVKKGDEVIAGQSIIAAY
jgi:phosphatidylserine decarboxylase